MQAALLCAAAAVRLAHSPCLPRHEDAEMVRVVSDRPVVFEMDNWESQTLLTWAAMILLRDTLGLNVTLRTEAGGSALYERAARGGANGTCATCGHGVDANMEVWPNTKMQARAEWMCASTACGAASANQRDCVHETKHTATGQSR